MSEEKKSLEEAMPSELVSYGYEDTRAYKMRDIVIIKEHCTLFDQDEYLSWPGTHKNVYFWVELENGYAVGWNENPARGWSFPVVKI